MTAKLRDRGVTLILTTHDMQEAAALDGPPHHRCT